MYFHLTINNYHLYRQLGCGQEVKYCRIKTA